MKEHTEDRLIHFLHTMLEPFTLKALLEFLGEPSGAAARDDLADYLSFNQYAFLNPSFDGEEESWITRAGLFTGKSVVILPTKDEISSGILIPGSRLVPFYDPTVLPNELLFRYQGQDLGRLVLDVSPEEVYPHYAMFGEEYVPQYLALDNEENATLFSPADYDDPSTFPVSVINLRSVYWDANFKPGDRIFAKSLDWGKGIFEVSVVSDAEPDKKRQLEWLSDFEECLLRSFELVGPGAAIDEQLTFAWYLGQDRLFSPFATCLDEFLRWTLRVAIEPYGVETRLWFTGEEIPPQGTWDMAMVSSPSSVTEELLSHLGLPFTDSVLEAYILDALFRKETGIEPMLDRIFPVRNSIISLCIPVLDKEFGRRFHSLAKGYNWFADHDTGVLRNRFVELHNAIADFVGMLKASMIRPESVPDQGAVVLGQLLSHAVSGLESLNADYKSSGDREKPSEKTVFDEAQASERTADNEVLWASIEGMEDSFFDIKTVILEALPELRKRNLSIIKKKENKEKKEKPDE